MTFTADWLALREPADHRARDAKLRDEAASFLSGRSHVTIVDLAAGTGSNLRAFAPFVDAAQDWILVDVDASLIAAAQERSAAWAVLQKPARLPNMAFRRIDLSVQPGTALDGKIDIVTAAAFFDLVSNDWIATFCDELSRRRLSLYAALTYSGQEIWTPSHPFDGAALAAFHRHQKRDKGFGPAAGPDAAQVLQQCLLARGYRISSGYSPWRLGQDDRELITALADGAARAIGETGADDPSTVESWRQARRVATCEIGHIDLFATPA